MKKVLILAIFLVIIGFQGFSQVSVDSVFPIAQIEKKVDSKSVGFGDKLEFYAGKFVGDKGIVHYLKLRLIHTKFICNQVTQEVYEGMIYEDEFPAALSIIDKLMKKIALLGQYPDNYNVSYYYEFSDGTKFGISRRMGSQRVKFEVTLENYRFRITKVPVFKNLISKSIEEARKL